MKADYLIVGSGLTGATLARLLAGAGQDVLVLERRGHLGGNVHDHTHPSGIRIHTYGPHYFRTGSDTLWEFVNRFATFDPYEPCLKSLVDGACENWPVSASYIARTVGTGWQPAFSGIAANFEEASLSMMPRAIYEKFVKGYSEKQWGVPATSLSASLARRFDVREDGDPRLMRHKYQGIPSDGYAAFMVEMLRGIPTVLNFDYLANREAFEARKLLIFTGPVDEFFGCRFGRLRYRGQQRRHRYLPDCDFIQPCGQVNNPSPEDGPHIRTLEWKHMMAPECASRIRGTVLTTETPVDPADSDGFEYPFPDPANAAVFERYATLARAMPGLLICGRLGEYRYLDMDQAIGRAMKLFDEISAGTMTRPMVAMLEDTRETVKHANGRA